MSEPVPVQMEGKVIADLVRRATAERVEYDRKRLLMKKEMDDKLDAFAARFNTPAPRLTFRQRLRLIKRALS